MNFRGGVKEAAKILASLSMSERDRILSDIAKSDPQRAELLKNNIVSFDDLKFTTVKMLAELLREIKISDLALGLRLASTELKSHILSNVSSSIRIEIEETLNGKPRPVSDVEESIERIMLVVRRKLDLGELVLSNSSDIIV